MLRKQSGADELTDKRTAGYYSYQNLKRAENNVFLNFHNFLNNHWPETFDIWNMITS